jgi:tetratricopeptide (TPR) repeat protein
MRLFSARIRWALFFMAAAGLFAQTGDRAKAPAPDKAAAYYNYAMGHLYADLATAFGNRAEYLNKAIDFYKKAMKDDPAAGFLSEELSDLYIQAGRLREVVRESEEALKASPNDLTARRILGRIYVRLVGDPNQRGLNTKMLEQATEQYKKITELDASDADAWLMLGRLYKMGQNSVDAKVAYEKVLAADPENVDALSGLAMVYSDVGDTAKAAELLKKVSEKNPNLRTLVSLAQAYEQMREYKLAAQTLKRAAELQPENPELQRELASTLLQADELEEALEIFNEIVAQEPKDVQSWLRISQIHRQQNRMEKAWEAHRKAAALEPNNIEIRYDAVNLFEAQGKLPEAIAAMKEVLNDNLTKGTGTAEKANRAMLLERLGLLYRNNNQHAEAVKTFREMGQLDPKQIGPRAAAQIVDTWRQSREYQKSVQEADEALKLYPNDRMIRLVRATSLVEIGRGKEAVEEIKSMLTGSASDRDTHLQLAQLHDRLRNFGEMAKSLDAAEKLSTTPEEKEAVWFSRGAMFEKQKKFDEAEREFRKVLEANPNNASALNYLGYMFADRNVRLQEAEKLIVKALEQDPGNGAYLDSLGWVQYRLGRYQEAEDSLVSASQKVPQDPTVQDHLGDVYLRASSEAERELVDITKVQKKLEGAKTRLARETGAPRDKQP